MVDGSEKSRAQRRGVGLDDGDKLQPAGDFWQEGRAKLPAAPEDELGNEEYEDHIVSWPLRMPAAARGKRRG